MPHIFTHLENHAGFEPDPIGHDIPSLEQAIMEAGRTAGGTLADDIGAGRSPIAINLYLEDEAGERLATIRVTAVVDRP